MSDPADLTSPRALFVLAGLFLIGIPGVAGCGGSESSAPDRTEFTKVDLHTHYYYDRPFLPAVLEEWRMHSVVLNGGPAETNPDRPRWRAIRRMHERHPGRFFPVTSFDASRIDAPDFADSTIAQLRRDLAEGARGVKVWKEVGMIIGDSSGAYVQIDDPRFDPIWSFLAEKGVPVIAHIADPRAAWQPLDEESPHYSYYESNPEYHAYRHPELPRWEEIIAARDRWLAENPDLTVIGAHMGSMAHDVSLVDERFDEYPNFYVDVGGRFPDLRNQSRDAVRASLIEHADRVLYGTDLGTDVPAAEAGDGDWPDREAIDERYRDHWEYLSRELALPTEVLRKIYGRNAARLLDLPIDA